MSDEDILALKAYLSTVKPVSRENREPELTVPFNWRFLLAGWKWRYFNEGQFGPPNPEETRPVEPGCLSRPGGHALCRVPHATGLGRRAASRSFSWRGPPTAPRVRPRPTSRRTRRPALGDWSVEDMVELLKSSYKPDGDNVQGLMERVVIHGYEHMNDEDLTAIAVYLRSLPAIDNRIE